MRYITTHMVAGGVNELQLAVTDAPGPGGACHRYVVTGLDMEPNLSCQRFDLPGNSGGNAVVLFQHGPVGVDGHNGVTNEVLLAIVDDRLRSFQAGPFPDEYNAQALSHVQAALEILKRRTIDRRRRGVEGQNKQ